MKKEEDMRKTLEDGNTKLLEEKNGIFLELEANKAALSESEGSSGKLAQLKASLEKQIAVSFQKNKTFKIIIVSL